jgi:hypothetical protein
MSNGCDPFKIAAFIGRKPIGTSFFRDLGMNQKHQSTAGGLPAPRSHQKRRNYLVDKRFQLTVALAGVMAVGIGLIIGLGALFLLPSAADLEMVSGQSLRILVIGVTVGHFVLVAGAVAIVAIVITHRVAGPAEVLRNAIEGMANGRYDLRSSIRGKDYLQDVAVAVQSLKERLGTRQELDDRLAAELEQALADEDHSQVRAVVRRWTSTRAERMGDLASGPSVSRTHRDSPVVEIAQ